MKVMLEKNFKDKIKNFSNITLSEEGHGMVEYGLILGLVAIATLTVISMLGNDLYYLFFNKVKTSIGSTNQ